MLCFGVNLGLCLDEVDEYLGQFADIGLFTAVRSSRSQR